MAAAVLLVGLTGCSGKGGVTGDSGVDTTDGGSTDGGTTDGGTTDGGTTDGGTTDGGTADGGGTTDGGSTDGGETGDTGLPAPEGDPATVDLDGLCDLDVRLGSFSVEALEDYSTVYGDVSNGVVPVSILEETLAEGECRLMKRNTPFCDPPCAAGETCDFDGECVPYPETQDLGTVTVAGLEEDVRMSPVSPGYSYFDTSLPHPAFAAGALIQLDTYGPTYDPMTLHGVGFTPLEIPEEQRTWDVVAGEPLALTWTPSPDAVQRAEVALELNVDQHGTSPITVWCSFEDDGAAEVPASVIDALLGAGVTGFPSGRLIRRTADKVEIDAADSGGGCVDFLVTSPREADVTVSGHVPCFDDRDCPPGQECNELIQTCE